MIVSVAGGALLSDTVTVSVLSEFWVTVCTIVAALDSLVAAEPPSTATTEYGTRFSFCCCLPCECRLRGREYAIKASEESARVVDVKRILTE